LNLQPSQVPKTGFQINPDYNEQFKVNPKWQSKIKETSKDDMGNDAAVYITDKNKFFAKLMKDQIIIMSQRDGETSHVYEEISIKNLGEVVETSGFPQGKGIEDFGNFAEGFCFKLNGMVDGNDLTWIVCCHSLFEKE